MSTQQKITQPPFMASSSSSLFPLLCFIFVLHPFPSIAKPHKLLKSHLLTTQSTSPPATNETIPPTVFFEVTKPIKVPKTEPCVHHLLHHDFGYSYAKPPVLTNYTPPSHCPSLDFSTVVFEWKATCKGRQFDRIFGVWLGGVELLRSCTAEPIPDGIVWTVQKDITRYSSLLVKNVTQELAVYLGNVITSVYTGVYHVDITIYFYPADKDNSLSELGSGDDSKADLILPISRNLPLNGGLWFKIKNSTDIESKEFKIPQNVYRAVLEVYVSFHENDEFWYTNFPNEYISCNNLTGYNGNGPFREVVVSLDGKIVGAVWPFTVIYTGGANPLYWRPITGIGSFDLPTYDIEITPFLGSLLDNKSHEFQFKVTNALNVWFIDANLHLWLDQNVEKTEGKVVEHDGKPLVFSLVSNFKGMDGTFLTTASRSISSHGWVKSSHGNITTHFNQHFSYCNSMEMGNDADLQIVNQTIGVNDTISSDAHLFRSLKNFQLNLSSDEVDLGNGTSSYAANVTLGFDEKNLKHVGFGFASSSLNNLQNAGGYMIIKGNLVQSGLGTTWQVYKYHDGAFCYLRNVSSSNYTILYDEVNETCHKENQPHLGFGLGKWLPFSSRRTSVIFKLMNCSEV